MKKTKHIVALIVVLAIIIGVVAILFPLLEQKGILGEEKNESVAVVEETVEDTTETDTLSFKDKLQQELETIQTTYSKRKKIDIWTLGRGQSIINYLLQTQRFTKKNGGRILYMEELHNGSALQSAKVILLQPDQDTLQLELQVSESIFRSEASILAVAFQVTKLTPELIADLNRLDYPFTLLIPPFGMQDGFFPDLDKISDKELVLWLTMESTQLNKVHNKLRPLRIHHTEEQIETVVDDSKKLIPSAKGIVSRFGEQAVEHEQLLQAILKPAKKNGLWFLDATMNKRSKTADACKALKMTCQSAATYNPENSALNDYINQKLREAKKKGLATMIIPLDVGNLDKVKDLSERTKSQGTSLVYLSKFMTY